MWLKPDCFIERALTTNFVVKKRPNSSACKILEECSWLKTFSFGITQWTKGLSLEKTAFLAPQPVAVIWNIKIPVVVWQFSELPHWCSLKWIKDIRSLINLIRFFAFMVVKIWLLVFEFHCHFHSLLVKIWEWGYSQFLQLCCLSSCVLSWPKVSTLLKRKLHIFALTIMLEGTDCSGFTQRYRKQMTCSGSKKI